MTPDRKIPRNLNSTYKGNYYKKTSDHISVLNPFKVSIGGWITEIFIFWHFKDLEGARASKMTFEILKKA